MKHKVEANKTWNFLRSDVSTERAGKIGEEMVDAMCDRIHNASQCVLHPFKKEKRKDMRTLKHHWE